MPYKLSKTIPYPKTPYAIAVSPDGALLGATCFDQKLRLYDAATMEERKVIHVGTSFPHACGFSADSGSALAGGKAISFFDPGTGKRGLTLKGHRDEIFRVAVTANGKRAVTSSGANVQGADCTLRAWELPSGKQLSRWNPDNEVFGLALSPDGKQVAGCTNDGQVLAGEVGAKAPKWTQTWKDSLYGVAYSPDGKEIWVGGTQTELGVFSAKDGELLRTVKVPGATMQLLFLSDGNLLLGVQNYSASDEGRLLVLDRKGKKVWSGPKVARMFHGVAASPDSKTLYGITSDPDTLVVFRRT